MAHIYNGEGICFSHSCQTDPSEKEFELHVHDAYEILCLVTGNVKYIVEGHEYDMPNGCMMLMRPAETHRLIVNGRGTYERYVIHFKAESLRRLGSTYELLRVFNDRPLGLKNQYLPRELMGLDPVGVFSRMKEECESLDNSLAVTTNLCSLLLAAGVAFQRKDAHTAVSVSGDSGRAMLEYINENISAKLSLTDVSRHVHLSPSQANRVFKRITGTSIYDYIISKRLVMAKELIARGEGAIAASQRCGFDDYSSFYRLCKKRFGDSEASK